MRFVSAMLLMAGLCVALTGCKSANCGEKCTTPCKEGCTKPCCSKLAEGADLCAKCPGVQVAGTDVKCDKCGMMLKK